jgi:aminocarboxymuconate-semialdehyde decarboxylase
MTNPPGPRPTTVDVHAHLMPDAAFDGVPAPLEAVTNDAGERAVRSPDRPELGRGAPADLRSLSDHRARQAARGVDVSLVGPWVDQVKAPLDPGVQAAWCRAINAGLAAACAGQGHSRWLAALPDLDGALAAEVLAEAAEHGAVGGMLAANPDVGTLARPDLDHLWRAAEAARLPLVVHPGEYRVPERLRPFFLVNLVGNPFETTLAAASLLARGVPDRFAELRLVLVHGGGFLPYQFGRLDAGFDRWPGLRGVATSSPRDHLAWFAYDTVLFDDAPTRYLLDLVGPERVLAGSDCPFTMADHRPFEAPGGLGLGPAETEAVLGGNARALFRLDDL